METLSAILCVWLYKATCIAGATTLTWLLFKAVDIIEHPRKRRY